MRLAAAGDTWGISGPTFLVFFISALIGVVVLSAIHRRILFAGRSGGDAARLHPQQVAYLTGRDRLAVYASLGGLRAAGAIGSGPDRTLTQTGPLPTGATPLDVAIYNAAGRRIRARDVNTDQWVTGAVRQLREGLEADGFAVAPGQRRTARVWALVAVVVLVAGAARLVDGMQNDRPVFFLFPLVFVAAVTAVLVYARANVAQTHAAARALRELRVRHLHLSPRHSPSYATYGSSDAAMGVALFGTASLFASDPAFAADAEVQRVNASGGGDGGSSSSGGGGSCGGGSSCGGGGGGGGCGGGGCGG
jgi:uncharacterized protein (TIGR04222 family)